MSEHTAESDAACQHEPFASDEGGPVFCGKCQWPLKPGVIPPAVSEGGRDDG
jgi:hypothetical protein